ncbi:peptidyl-prolyl cis-trans isomerase FKBP20-2, chloroplastic [Hevea brasiliensis]|uniref:peptidyl-prolyl cis-trans isomerase FKBP20-2, chloroplastic n=1 Tax=Hevea brasiliensis TaxID=3981 RepID=UPI0025F9660D|nr:peptidyl-prolyl cis-trans isomerase FKBP20-2, chloroplastic [Hevea brasiliensis]
MVDGTRGVTGCLFKYSLLIILSRGYYFPFNKGNLVEQPDGYTKHPKSGIIYHDIIVGRGHPVRSSNLKVTIHYDFYDQLHKLIQSNAVDRSPEEVHLCWHRFGEGFEEGIRGMRPGGMRRIIVTLEHRSSIVGRTYEVYDVVLLKVEKSCSCPLSSS